MDFNTLESLKPAILELANKNKAENIRVFGSVARGDSHSASDVDFLVHFRPDASLMDMAGLDEDLSTLLGCKVDIISDRAIKDEFAPFILSEARPL